VGRDSAERRRGKRLYADAFFLRAGRLVTCDTSVEQNGITFEDLGTIPDAAILIDGDRIAAIGRDRDVAAHVPHGAEEIDVRDCVVVPGFVDAHSHPLFAGDREPDFAARLRGEKPQQGMLHTVARTREALRGPATFYERTVRPRLRKMLAHGTTTLETKTGYALTKDGEFALLDVIREHREDEDVPRLVATFLGAHALPREFETFGAYVEHLIDDCLPGARSHGAEYADAFCEPGFFTLGDSRRYLEAARKHGLRLRVHCDEMSDGGAARMAAELGVDAVDHCNYVDERGAKTIAESGAVLVACPATIEFLSLERHAPVRAILDAGGMVALASDFNPGTSPCYNLQTIAYYGRKLFGLSASEALYGTTRAAARSLRSDAGVLRVGGLADVAALQIDDPREFGWYFGGNMAKLVVKSGALVAGFALDDDSERRRS
jgi:imidazolonepropionase